MLTKSNLTSQRVYSIDILRGFVMIVMALDHVRDYFHFTASLDSPTNLLTTTPLLFFTRWITHFCAPTFVLLAGISAFLYGQKKTKKELSLFLIKRGVWLILVEIFIVTLGWTFDPLYHTVIIQVIWTFGISMVILGLLIWLPLNAILITGLAIIFFHNLLDFEEVRLKGNVGIFWKFLHYANFSKIQLTSGTAILLVYAFLPWTGIMLVGYRLGRLFSPDYRSPNRRRNLYLMGTASIILFLILRSMNQYGDPSHWFIIRNRLYSSLSFLNVSKYPPSLEYILLTVGVALVALAALDRVSKNSFEFIRVFGRVPFFFYVIHIYLIHLITVIVFFSKGYSSKDISPQHSPFMFRPDHFGFELDGVYLIWLGVILILYPLCSWYDQYKRNHKQWWLSYL